MYVKIVPTASLWLVAMSLVYVRLFRIVIGTHQQLQQLHQQLIPFIADHCTKAGPSCRLIYDTIVTTGVPELMTCAL